MFGHNYGKKGAVHRSTSASLTPSVVGMRALRHFVMDPVGLYWISPAYIAVRRRTRNGAGCQSSSRTTSTGS